ncbi:MAG: hypothetical protein GY744_16520 [Gammaproteobacteria bacterium]|nr:hypothetical protein [Gammaproteobacteria bacterium]
MKLIKLIILLPIFSLMACATSGVDQINKNTKIKIDYGVIKTAEPVTLKSEAGKTAAIGGLWGLVGGSDGNRNDMIGGAAVGALLMGLTTKIAEGTREAAAYEVEKEDGTIIKVIIDDKDILVGDCVAVESGKMTNLRKVADDLCGAQVATKADREIASEMAEDAQYCLSAKQQLLEAKTEEAVNSALKKVNVFCN